MIRCFGAFEVHNGGTLINAFPTHKIRALLAYLALATGQAHQRELLAGLLWPEMGQAAALNNLRLALHRLREALDNLQPEISATLLQSTRQTLTLNTAVVSVDVGLFQHLLATCAAHAHTELAHCTECLARLHQAVDLYRGELLADFRLTDAPAFEEWLLLQREMLHQQALATLHLLVQIYEQQGADEQAHDYASRQLALDPSREEAHRQLMRNLARRGQNAAALAQYETCRRILREQLNVAPDLETVALYEQIRSGHFDQVTGGRAQEREREQNTPLTPSPPHAFTAASAHPVTPSPGQEWSAAPTINKVYGRQAELAQMEQWLVRERCRLVAVLGIGGVGKTTLTAATVNMVAPVFDRVLWRSLLNAPPLDELLGDLLQRLADERLHEMPTGLDAQLTLLLGYLRQQRCLLVLDNLESILQADQPGHMQPGYAGYAQLLQIVAERNHQSTLMLTSRERPQGLARREEDSPLVRTLLLDGLDPVAGEAILTARGLLGPTADAQALVARYSGNPLALKLVAQTIQELFGGEIAAFLAVDAPLFDDIRTILDQQFARLSPLEQELLYWLAIEREPVTVQTLRDNLIQPGASRALIEALRALQRRSLVGQSPQGFLLQTVMIEYVTDVLVEQVCRAIDSDKQPESAKEQDILAYTSSVLHRYALLKATAKEYVRAAQVRLILQPVVTQILAQMGRTRLVARLRELLADLRLQPPAQQGYGAGNLLNLLLHIGESVQGYDFAGLQVWQAYLQGKQLPQVNFSGANLAHSVFTHTFGEIKDIQFDAEGHLLIAGSVEGQLHLWRVQGAPAASQLLHEYHSFGADATRADFSPDGRILASGHTDHRIRLWDVTHGHLLQTLVGHTEIPWSVVFSPSNRRLASGASDGTVYIWDSVSGQITHILHGHQAAVPALAFAADEQLLASSDVDGGVCVWQIDQAEPLYRLQGHSDEVHALLFAGDRLITSSHDRTIRLWDMRNGQPIRTLQAHLLPLRALALSPDGQTLASSGDDLFACLWDLRTGQIQHTLLDLSYPNKYLRFSADGRRLAAVRVDQSIALWHVDHGQRLDLLEAYSNFVYAVTFSPDSTCLASAGADCIIRLWPIGEAPATAPSSILQGHSLWINALAFRPDGRVLASGGNEREIQIWDLHNRRILQKLEGHTHAVEALQFSPNGQQLVSASRDKTVRIWEFAPKSSPSLRDHSRARYILRGHTERVRACAFSPDGRWVASGAMDRTVRLWEPARGEQASHILEGHTNGVHCLAFSPDGHLLISGSYDQTVCLWDVQRGHWLHTWRLQDTIAMALAFHPDGELLAIGDGSSSVQLWTIQNGQLLTKLHGHSNSVETICFSPDGRWLASGSYDETVKVWEVTAVLAGQTTERYTLRASGPYAGMNITGVTGISKAQKAALRALGAVEE